MEASDALSALHQGNLPKPSVVVVRYTNTPYIPQVLLSPLSRHEHTLWGASSAQFPLDQLCLSRLLSFSVTEVVLPQEEGEMGLKVFPPFPRGSMAKLRRGTLSLWSDFIVSAFNSPSSMSRRGHPRQREDWALTLPSSFHKIPIKQELSWNVSWSRKHRSWLKDMTIVGSNRPGGMRGGKHRWLSRQIPPFKRWFPRWAWLTLSSYCLGAYPLQFPSATWAEC